MLANWHSFWDALKPCFLTLVGLVLFVITVGGISKGETALRYSGMVYRAKSPIYFWFFVALNLLVGLAALGAGVVSFQ